MKLAFRASRRCFSMAEWQALSSAVKDRILFLPLRLLLLELSGGLADAFPAGVAIFVDGVLYVEPHTRRQDFSRLGQVEFEFWGITRESESPHMALGR